MEQFLHKIIFDNTIESYLYVLLIILFAFILKRVVSKYIAKLLFRLAGKAGKKIARESFLNLVVQPLDLFLLLLVGLIAVDKLNFPIAFDIKIHHIEIKKIFESITDGVVILAFIWLCLRVIDFIAMILEEKANLSPDQKDNQLIIFFKDFFKVILIIIGILLILRFSFNKNIGNLLTGLSIVGAAIALATRESMENLIASFIIFFDKPFATGDLVKVNGFIGNIEKIGLRSTRIRTQEKTYISVPNKQMVDTIVDNISLRTQRKAELKLEVSLTTNSTQLSNLINEITNLIAEPFSINRLIYLSDTGKNAHIINVEYYTSIEQTIEHFLMDKQTITLEIIKLMENSKIQFAAANTTVTVHSL